jgi:prepilin-type processing-associated H-X9-DG protein
VIGIVAALSALLLPALSIARERSRATVCASRMRTVYSAFVAYAGQNNNFVPRGYVEGSPKHPPFTALVAKQIGVKSPFEWTDVVNLPALHCPSHPTENLTTHYIVNAFSFGAQWNVAGLTRLDRIANRPNLPWLVETPPDFNSMTMTAVDDIFFEQYQLLSNPTHLSGNAEGKGRRIGRDNHGKKSSNVLFVDGHIERLDTDRLKLEQFDDGLR